jgi:hypothetical protein
VFHELQAIATLMAGYAHPWAVCGGWAIDLFLARQTREHKDVDVARRDQLQVRAYLVARGWRLQITHSVGGVARDGSRAGRQYRAELRARGDHVSVDGVAVPSP